MNRFLLPYLSEAEVKRIHQAALQILQNTGLSIRHDSVLSQLKEAGCPVNFDKMIVQFPPEIVEKYIGLVPKSYPVGRRDPGAVVQLDQEKLFTRPQSGCFNVINLDTGKVHPATKEDAVNITRLIDSMEHVDLCAALLYPWDVQPEVRDLKILEIMFTNSSKHTYIQPYNGQSTRYMVRMAESLRNSQETLAADPPITFIVGATSPLVYSENEIEVLIEIAKVGLPVMIGSTPIAGATAPVTIPGQILLQHIENLAGIVILQILRPGSPVTYAARPSFMDMRTANATWGNIEWGMATFGISQLAHSLGLLLDVVGFPTDSKTSDIQASVEKALNGFFGVLASANVLAGVGAIETIMTGSFEQIVIDNDIIGMLQRVRRGLEFDNDRLAESIISQVGISGNYLMEEHTLKYFSVRNIHTKII